MGRRCTVCSSPHRAAIESALLRGDSTRSIGEKYGVSHLAVYRHQQKHLAQGWLFEIQDPETERVIAEARHVLADRFADVSTFALNFGQLQDELEAMAARASQYKRTKERLEIADRQIRLLSLQGQMLTVAAQLRETAGADRQLEIEFQGI